MAANYTVALAGVAERLAIEAGVPRDIAERLYLPLIRGAVANLEAGPVAALTGPVRRGDVRTVEAHLSALTSNDRELYRLLGSPRSGWPGTAAWILPQPIGWRRP